jgi:tetratricopeptide (TPR) repeat protein
MQTKNFQTTTANIPTYWIWIVIGITFLAFSSAIGNDFVNWDDETYLINNTYIRDLSWNGIKKLFTEPIGEYSVYRPLTYVSYMIEYALWELNPKGYHFVSVLLHLINTYLVYQLILSLTKQPLLALFVALFFGIHPMRVESVAWILARVDPLYGCFFLLGSLQYLKYIAKNNWKNLVLTFVFFLGAIFSKPAAVVFPAVLCAIDFYYRRGLTIKVIVEKIPFFLASIAFGLYTMKVQKEAISDLSTAFTLLDRFFISSYAVAYYIISLFLPFNLNLTNPLPTKVNNLLPMTYYIAPLFLAVCVGAIFYFKQHRHFLLFAFALFLINVGLVIQIIPYGQAVVADRYSYLAHIALFLAVGYILQTLLTTKKEWKPSIQIGVVVFAIFCTFQTFTQNKVWANSATFWTYRLTNDREDYFAYFGRGNYYYSQNNIEAALADFQKAASFNRPNGALYNNLGFCYYLKGDYNKALQWFMRATQYTPQDAEAHNNKGNALYMLKDFNAAIQAYNTTLQLNPNHLTAMEFRGLSYLNLQQKEQACKDLQTASQLGNAEAGQYWQQYCK